MWQSFSFRSSAAFCAQDMHKQHEMALATTIIIKMCVAYRNSVAAKKEKLIRLIISNGDGLFCDSLFEGVPAVVRVCVCVCTTGDIHIGCCIERRKRRSMQEIASDRIHLRQCKTATCDSHPLSSTLCLRQQFAYSVVRRISCGKSMLAH